MKVYVITSGEYSDYRICAVTLDKEKAEKLRKRCDHFDYTGAQIEEYDTEESESLLIGNSFRVCFDKSGNVEMIAKNELTCYTLEMCKEKPSFNAIDNLLTVYVMANSAEDAIKIAAERRAKYLSEKMGL